MSLRCNSSDAVGRRMAKLLRQSAKTVERESDIPLAPREHDPIASVTSDERLALCP